MPNIKKEERVDHILVVPGQPSRKTLYKEDLIIDSESGDILKIRSSRPSNIKNLGFCYYERKMNA